MRPAACAVAVVGEQWELPLAYQTLVDLGTALPDGCAVVLPTELARLRRAVQRPVEVAGPPLRGFRSVHEIAADLRQRSRDRRLALISAGARVRPGGWPPRATRPGHAPPPRRRHRRRWWGEVPVWTVDTGTGYFQSILALSRTRRSSVPVWEQYGRRRAVFAYNTNRFDEPAPRGCDDYVVLASGLLGIRLVLESDPAAHARVVVYDTNPDQLAWVRHLLESSSTAQELPEVVEGFRARFPQASVRPVAEHEEENAELQRRWYRRHRSELAGLARHLPVRYVHADLYNRPDAVLSHLRSDRSACFMYLDLFTVWSRCPTGTWIADHPGLAASLEAAVAERAGGAVFVPGAASTRVQLQGDHGGAAPCT